ncbi:MAG: nif-specific transcriptional activator NifA [Desulfobacterota bacterium]|nr:nif-specific transcriptional activator NifA [Thermodesulfobacteriota bacterium]
MVPIRPFPELPKKIQAPSQDQLILSLERKIKELTVLYQISQLIGSNFDCQKVFPDILETFHTHLGMSRGTITLLNPLTQELEIRAAHGMTEEEIGRGKYLVGEGITGKVVETGEPMVVPQIGKEPLFLNRTKSRENLTKSDTSFICVPIKNGSNVLGALSVDRLFKEEISFEEDVRLLSIVAAMVAQGLKIQQMVEEEKKQLLFENTTLKEKLKERYNLFNILGTSQKMAEVFQMIEKVANKDVTVLIRGESGTGKELVANAIHYNSPRASKPFLKLNCAALPGNLIESELFGHEKGAFTGATEQRIGKFERADGGTLFLDEIGTLHLEAQAKLLRVLQEKEFERIGGNRTLRVDVRILAATNKNLERAIEEGTFREDLYYRLSIFPIFLPPLRERKTDILLLADFFIDKFNQKHKKKVRRISTQATDLLIQYHWPGNVRELENCIERAVLLCTDGVIRRDHLPHSLQGGERSNPVAALSFEDSIKNFQKELIIDALKKSRGNMAQAARLLKTTERVISYNVKKLRINPKAYRS